MMRRFRQTLVKGKKRLIGTLKVLTHLGYLVQWDYIYRGTVCTPKSSYQKPMLVRRLVDTSDQAAGAHGRHNLHTKCCKEYYINNFLLIESLWTFGEGDNSPMYSIS